MLIGLVHERVDELPGSLYPSDGRAVLSSRYAISTDSKHERDEVYLRCHVRALIAGPRMRGMRGGTEAY